MGRIRGTPSLVVTELGKSAKIRWELWRGERALGGQKDEHP